jgi:hypothetical protein
MPSKKTPERGEQIPASSQLTGVAGVHFVASYLSFLGFHAVPTTRNVPGPDLLVSSLDGSNSLTLQVKTTLWALRTRGRGESKQPHHLEWEVGPSSASVNNPNVWFAFVDLKKFQELPDTYIIPSKIIFDYFKYWVARFKSWNKTLIRYRWHPELNPVEPFKPVAPYKNACGWERLKHELTKARTKN